ncbi:MAG: TIR domain-containing protein [Parabacteroides sp.]|nr:TIR domain-containing protein [Parabacteroides sp.]
MVYNLFISHSWTYSDAYERLVDLLNNDTYFEYRNYSIPKDNPIHSARSMADLKESIRNKMFFASHVVILAGVYATYSKWINIEVELAKEMGKKIIAVEPWGAEHTSKFVKDSADVIVKWQTASIVSAIRGY